MAELGPITDTDAAAIALRAALATVPDAPKSLVARLRKAAAKPTPTTLSAASAAPQTKRVVHCTKDGSCAAAFKQVVFLPPTATTKPQELHVYVSAANGDVLLAANRLHTARPGGVAAAHAPAHGKKKGGDSEAETQIYMSLGRGNSLYSGEVPLNTAQGPSKAGGGPYQMSDLIHNTQTYDLKNKEDPMESNSGELLFKDRDNQWCALTCGGRAGF